MTHPQYGHRMNTNEHIMRAMQNNPDRWMTNNEIANIIGYSTTRGVAVRMRMVVDKYPEIETMIDDTTRKVYYRYNTVETNEE